MRTGQEFQLKNGLHRPYEKIYNITRGDELYFSFLYGVDKNMSADLMDSLKALNYAASGKDKETVDYFEAIVKKQEKTKHPPGWFGTMYMGLNRKIEGDYWRASNIFLV